MAPGQAESIRLAAFTASCCCHRVNTVTAVLVLPGQQRQLCCTELLSEHAGMWQSRVEPAGRSVAWLALTPSGMVPHTSASLCK